MEAVNELGEAGNLTGSGFLMNPSFLGGLINDGLGGLQLIQSLVTRCFTCRQPNFFNRIFDPGSIGSISQTANLILAGAFQC